MGMDIALCHELRLCMSVGIGKYVGDTCFVHGKCPASLPRPRRQTSDFASVGLHPSLCAKVQLITACLMQSIGVLFLILRFVLGFQPLLQKERHFIPHMR